MSEGLLDLGFSLDEKGLFPGLTEEQKKEWRNSVINAYIQGPGIYLAAYITVVFVTAYANPEGLNAYFSVTILLLLGLVILGSAYFVRKETLERRKLVWMASSIKWIRG